jgi:choline dehydrogenase
MTAAFDYIIAGGGTAGCVLANRLSTDPRTKVLLIEAGGTGDTFVNNMPAGSYLLMGNPKADWTYSVTPDDSIGERYQIWAAGKMLGGSSGMNGMVYIRGLRSDYDLWAAAGATGWGFDDVFPYFLKSEHFEGPPSQEHGRQGPLSVSPQSTLHPLTTAFVDACDAAGLRKRTDYCGGDLAGAFLVYGTTHNGRRASARSAFLAPASKRPNLQIVTGAVVDRVLIEQGRAVGVRVRTGTGVQDYRASAEVIVSCGTFGSPAVLLRSGIGPGAHLRALGIDVAHDLPSVGENLQEHTGTAVMKFVDVPTYNTRMKPHHLAGHLSQYLMRRNGQLTSIAVQAMAYGRSSLSSGDPDIVMGIIPMALDLGNGKPRPHAKPGITLITHIGRPRSRGRVQLQASDPTAKPKIDFRLLGNADDLRVLTEAGRLLERVFAQPPLARHVTGSAGNPGEAAPDSEWKDYLRMSAATGYHAVGTCRMGGAESVVDPSLRVRGIAGLRVADASVMPNIISCNTQATVYMIAEKAAEMISAQA